MRGAASHQSLARASLSSFKIQLFLALLVSALAVWSQASDIRSNVYSGDSHMYMGVAKDLVDHGRFTNGDLTDKALLNEDGTRPSGMFFAPLYPALTALVMANDAQLYATTQCHADARALPDASARKQAVESCPHDFGALKTVNIILAILTALFVWITAWLVSKRAAMAWVAMGLALLAEAYAYYTGQVMTENLVFPLFTALSAALVFAAQKKQARYWLLAGILFGLLALTRPSFSYLFYAAVPAMMISYIMAKAGWQRALLWAAALIVGYGATIAPWVARNAVKFDTLAISKGYASFILVQRVAYNAMSWKEFGVSFIYALPDFGDSLAPQLFARDDYERFDYDTPNGFYLVGNSALRTETLEKAGGQDGHLSYLLKNYVAAEPFKHIMVTLSLAWRGMWVSKYWGLIAIPVFLGVFIVALRRRWVEFIIIAIPPWFMLGFHAFTSVNVVRYNLILIPCLAIAVAFVLISLYDKLLSGRAAKRIKPQ